MLLVPVLLSLLPSYAQKHSCSDFALGVKTSRFYHDTRLRALMSDE